jgi:hypothetical protein
MDEPVVVALGPCCTCGQFFEFDPDKVPSVSVDPVTNRPPDVDAAGLPCTAAPEALARVRQQPYCPSCARLMNGMLREQGKAPRFDETDTAAALYG